MAVTEEYLEFILDQLSLWKPVTPRKMFGGVSLYCEGEMFAIIASDEIYFRVDEKGRDKLIKLGSFPFHPFKEKPPSKSYWEIPPSVLENSLELTEYAEEAVKLQKKIKKKI